MSSETSLWLNTKTLIGHTDKRGNAWHYRAEDQGAESNHYAGAVPVEDIRRRIFNFNFVEGDVSSNYLTVDGVYTVIDPERKAIIRPAGTFGPTDKGAIMGIFKSGFQVHPYWQWLVEGVQNILDSGLDVGSAGLLKGGAVAWVQTELADTIVTPEGVAFRPFLTAATSVDGSLSSTFNRGVTAVVCDNTLSAALGDRTQQIKVKHSRNSLGRIGEIRDALGIVHDTADEFTAQVKALCEETVTDKQWSAFLDAHSPVVDAKGEAKTGRGLTLATNERDSLTQLWNSDLRVSPWKNTTFGVVQAVNTFTHHVQTVRGASRAERNMLRMATGGVDALDLGTLTEIRKVLATV